MPIAYGTRELTDAYLLYDRQLVGKDIELTPKCKFYACDFIDKNNSSITLDGIGTTYQSTLTIKALIQPNIVVNKDDIVYSIKDDERWRITNIQIQDDNTMKRNSMHPRQHLILTLIK